MTTRKWAPWSDDILKLDRYSPEIRDVRKWTSYDNLRKTWRNKFIFKYPLYLQGKGVKFVLWKSSALGQGHRTDRSNKKGGKCVFPQCKTSIGHIFASVKNGALRFACSREFSDIADRWCDRHLSDVTGSDHNRMPHTRLQLVPNSLTLKLQETHHGWDVANVNFTTTS